MTQFAQESSDQETQKEKETTKELDSEEEVKSFINIHWTISDLIMTFIY